MWFAEDGLFEENIVLRMGGGEDLFQYITQEKIYFLSIQYLTQGTNTYA